MIMRILTEQEETLLFNDICARIPYGIKIAEISDNTTNGAYEVMAANKETKVIGFNTPTCLIRCYRNMEMIKPYLRSMSSMTDEERKEYNDIVKNTIDFYDCPKSEEICFFIMPIEWLNKHHFDYRGLIEKGLAIEVTKENSPYK